ncbi:hypothetical protein [uncultured Pseudacidovorax sp.]|uniref:hypothetical protein n=1 Tax=uncultured Pseudacidovorax sp. TaxID=679313 RepID=UPI0025E58BAF|nr:hypothetical protein [uncultured Pseudacidovorax sp.]
MNRCSPRHAFSLLAAALLGLGTAALVAPRPALAQTQNEAALGGRNFPDGTLRGRLRMLDFPQAELDGRLEVLAPGTRIRNAQNMVVTGSMLLGQDLAVNYLRDPAGQVQQVWILTPDEAAAPRASAGGQPLLNFWPFVTQADNEGG